MKRNKLLPALLLTAALMLQACNQKNTDVQSEETDTQTAAPVITETQPDTPEIPVIIEPTTETEPVELPEVPDETEPTPETELIPELPADLPTEEVPEQTTEPSVTESTEAPAPIVIVKPTVDISEQLIPGGAPVTGQTVSAQSEHIQLLLDYTVEQTTDGTTTLNLSVGLSCYELWCGAKSDMGTITVNGVSRTFSTDAIDHMTREKAYIPFLTQTYNATGSQSASVEVSWVFNGNYGGVDIGTLTTGVILKYDSPSGTAGAPAEITPETPTTDAPVTETPTEENAEENTEETTAGTPAVAPVAPPIDADTVVDVPTEPAPAIPEDADPIEIVIPTPEVPDDNPAVQEPVPPTEPIEPSEIPTEETDER